MTSKFYAIIKDDPAFPSNPETLYGESVLWVPANAQKPLTQLCVFRDMWAGFARQGFLKTTKFGAVVGTFEQLKALPWEDGPEMSSLYTLGPTTLSPLDTTALWERIVLSQCPAYTTSPIVRTKWSCGHKILSSESPDKCKLCWVWHGVHVDA